MKKTILLLIIFYLSSLSSSFGQTETSKIGDATITWGPEIEINKGHIVEIIGDDGNHIYALATKGKDYYLKIFDSKTMKLKVFKEIKLPEVDEKEISLEEVMILDSKLFLIGSVYDKKTKTKRLVGVELSKSGSLTNNRIEFFQTQVMNKRHSGEFLIKKTADESKFIALFVSDFPKVNEYQYEMKVVNSSGVILGETKGRLAYGKDKHKTYKVLDFEANNNGDMFLATTVSTWNKTTDTHSDEFSLSSFLKKDNYSEKKYKTQFSSNAALNGQININKTEGLQLFGYYTETKKSGKTIHKKLEGLYFANVDIKNQKVSDVVFSPFDKETKAKIMGEKKAEKDKDLGSVYTIRGVVSSSADGSLTIAAMKSHKFFSTPF